MLLATKNAQFAEQVHILEQLIKNKITTHSKKSVMASLLQEDQLQGTLWRLREGAITWRPFVFPKHFLACISCPILKLKQIKKGVSFPNI